jgi:hypothetical protein
MKNLLVMMVVAVCVLNALSQGTVVFNNRISSSVLQTHVYLDPWIGTVRYGNGPNDFPPGNTDWTGFPLVEGSGWMAALVVNPGPNQVFSGSTTTFRTGAAAGYIVPTTATLPGVAKDAASATLAMFVWETKGMYMDPATAWNAWQNDIGWAGMSKPFIVQSIGGDLNVPPILTGLESFCLPYIPEPSSASTAVLGVATAWWFRRRR